MSRLCDFGIGHPSKVATLAILISLTSIPSLAQNNSPSRQDNSLDQPGPDEYRISVDVGLVVLPVVVTDRKGQAVSGLEKSNFQVFEDGRPQEIDLFEAEDVPVTVGLVVDNSGSMAAKRPEVIAAAEAFAKSSNPYDQMFVVNFNQRVFMGLPKGVPFTGDVQQLRGALSRTPASGNTALYDGISVALDHLNAGTANRKALIIVSDGGDNASRLKFPGLLKRAEASIAQIYALGVYDQSFEGEDMSKLRRLSKVTGGKSYFPASPSEMTGICAQIAQDLRRQYTIGYHPSNQNSLGKYHSIRVTAMATRDGKLHVSTRAGYLMPTDSSALPLPAKASL
ncbi:MAG: VWA domain-containing protein [Terriglobia bacterium]|jgi:VWFA-related protein